MWRKNRRDAGPLGVETGVVGETVPEVDVGNGKRNTLGGRIGGGDGDFGWRDLGNLQVLIWPRGRCVWWRRCDVALRNMFSGKGCGRGYVRRRGDR